MASVLDSEISATDSLLDVEASELQGSALVDFLLDVMPAYHRICTESREDVRRQMEAEFRQQLLQQPPTEPQVPKDLSLRLCR